MCRCLGEQRFQTRARKRKQWAWTRSDDLGFGLQGLMGSGFGDLGLSCQAAKLSALSPKAVIRQLCPLCRVAVDDSTCMDVAGALGCRGLKGSRLRVIGAWVFRIWSPEPRAVSNLPTHAAFCSAWQGLRKIPCGAQMQNK